MSKLLIRIPTFMDPTDHDKIILEFADGTTKTITGYLRTGRDGATYIALKYEEN